MSSARTYSVILVSSSFRSSAMLSLSTSATSLQLSDASKRLVQVVRTSPTALCRPLVLGDRWWLHLWRWWTFRWWFELKGGPYKRAVVQHSCRGIDQVMVCCRSGRAVFPDRGPFIRPSETETPPSTLNPVVMRRVSADSTTVLRRCTQDILAEP